MCTSPQEGCTGWLYVVEELAAAGITPHLAEPAGTAALRGNKRHAKTDRTDTALLRSHLAAGDLPESWIPPEHVLEAMLRLHAGHRWTPLDKIHNWVLRSDGAGAG
jgi:transposase